MNGLSFSDVKPKAKNCLNCGQDLSEGKCACYYLLKSLLEQLRAVDVLIDWDIFGTGKDDFYVHNSLLC